MTDNEYIRLSLLHAGTASKSRARVQGAVYAL